MSAPFDVLRADRLAMCREHDRTCLSPAAFALWVRDETAKAVRAETNAEVTKAWDRGFERGQQLAYETAEREAKRTPTPSALTEEAIARAFEVTRREQVSGAYFSYRAWEDVPPTMRAALVAFARRSASLSSPDAAAVREKEYDRMREVLEFIASCKWTSSGDNLGATFNELRAANAANAALPAPPAAPRSVVLACGDVVSVIGTIGGELRLLRHDGDGDPNKENPAYSANNWLALMEQDDTGADFDAVKSLASTLAGRDK